jgi:hypothetical protein
MTMKEGAACKEYQFEVLPEVETTLPPMVAPPENLPTVPPSVNLPENRSGIRKVTNAVNRRK